MKMWLAALLLVACGGGKTPGTLSGDACTTDSDCSGNATHCVYKIEDACAATGICVAPPSGSMCGAVEELCGCDGNKVTAGCGFPDGYASGPTTNEKICTL